MLAAAESSPPGRVRRVAFRTLVIVFALAALLPGFGLADLTGPINPSWE
jgi:hypothetical protein